MFVIYEMQTSNNDTAIVTPVKKQDINEAWQAFYTACAAASVSKVREHTVVLMHHSGNVIESKEFRHEVSDNG